MIFLLICKAIQIGYQKGLMRKALPIKALAEQDDIDKATNVSWPDENRRRK